LRGARRWAGISHALISVVGLPVTSSCGVERTDMILSCVACTIWLVGAARIGAALKQDSGLI
jgi:hypothetical protein